MKNKHRSTESAIYPATRARVNLYNCNSASRTHSTTTMHRPGVRRAASDSSDARALKILGWFLAN